MSTTLERTPRERRLDPGRLRIALPERGLALEQDSEWCLIKKDGRWEEVRFHDYGDLYRVPGLYERIFYKILKCDSPATIRRQLETTMRRSGADPKNLRVLDVGAGNGMVGEELVKMGIESVVGVDIIETAVRALDRDRPGLYDAYFVADLTRLSEEDRACLSGYRFNGLTCVAALGFGDIPPEAFATAFNFVENGGWIAFNIKDLFLSGKDSTGFSRLIRAMIDNGTLEIHARHRYRHRLATNGDPLFYMAVVGRKTANIPAEMLEQEASSS